MHYKFSIRNSLICKICPKIIKFTFFKVGWILLQTNVCHSCTNIYSPENLFQNLQGVHKFTFAGVMPSNQGLRLETP